MILYDFEFIALGKKYIYSSESNNLEKTKKEIEAEKIFRSFVYCIKINRKKHETVSIEIDTIDFNTIRFTGYSFDC